MLIFEKPEGPPMLVSDRRLCLDAGKSQVLESGDPRAAYMLVCEGGMLAVSEAEKYGLRLVEGKFVLPKSADPEPEPLGEDEDA